MNLEELYSVASKLAFVMLAIWVVMAGIGQTKMPGYHPPHVPNPRKNAIGTKWGIPVVQAQEAEADLAFPAAPVM